MVEQKFLWIIPSESNKIQTRRIARTSRTPEERDQHMANQIQHTHDLDPIPFHQSCRRSAEHVRIIVLTMTVAPKSNLPSFHTESGRLGVGPSLLPIYPVDRGFPEEKSDLPNINVTWSNGSSLFGVQATGHQRKAVHGNAMEDM